MINSQFVMGHNQLVKVFGFLFELLKLLLHVKKYKRIEVTMVHNVFLLKKQFFLNF